MTPPDASNAAKDIGDRLASDASMTRDNVKSLDAAITDSVQDFVTRGAKATADLSDRAKSQLNAAADRVSDHASETLDASKRAYHTSSKVMGRQVAKQPLEALMLAAAIGYLVGWAANRS